MLSVTAVVASRNEIKHIEACVRSLLLQEEPEGGFEIIVVDGMSEDGTRAVLALPAQPDRRLQARGNRPAARHCGLRTSGR
jgi:glycosyltransferase involved in cell wall biosynthesis